MTDTSDDYPSILRGFRNSPEDNIHAQNLRKRYQLVVTNFKFCPDYLLQELQNHPVGNFQS